MATTKSADCAEMYPSGKWQPLNCEHGRSFVCQKIEKATPSKMTTRFGGTGGCHKRYGCGGKTAGCSTLCQRIRALRERRKARKERREQLRRQARRRRAERHEWRERMRRVREYRNKRLRKALNSLRRKHDRASRTYAYIASLLHTKLKQMKYSGQLAPVGMDRIAYSLGEGQRKQRRMLEEEQQEMRFIDMISRCKWIEIVNMRSFELCIHFNVGAEYYNLEIKIRSDTNTRNGKEIDYLDVIENTKHLFAEGIPFENAARDWSINPIASHFGYMMSRHGGGEHFTVESHSDFVHYFDEYHFDYFGFTMDGPEECSQILNGLPFKMCVSTIGNHRNSSDIELHFEKDMNDEYDADEMYSFQIKELVDKAFEGNVLRFNEDGDWDEIEMIDHMDGFQWIKKCNHRLLLAQVCVEQFDEHHHRASIKMRESTLERSPH